MANKYICPICGNRTTSDRICDECQIELAR